MQKMDCPNSIMYFESSKGDKSNGSIDNLIDKRGNCIGKIYFSIKKERLVY